jgi:hypothetical protein
MESPAPTDYTTDKNIRNERIQSKLQIYRAPEENISRGYLFAPLAGVMKGEKGG